MFLTLMLRKMSRLLSSVFSVYIHTALHKATTITHHGIFHQLQNSWLKVQYLTAAYTVNGCHLLVTIGILNNLFLTVLLLYIFAQKSLHCKANYTHQADWHYGCICCIYMKRACRHQYDLYKT